MREICYCGWSGELEDREPVLDALGRWMLRCPECGHLEDLGVADGGVRPMVWGEAQRRREDPLEAA